MEQSQPLPKPLTIKISSLQNRTSITATTPSASTPSAGFLSAGSPTPQTPSQPPKIKIVRKSQPPTPADAAPPSFVRHATTPAVDAGAPASGIPKITKPKPPKLMKPTFSKKRTKEESDDDDDVPLSNGTGMEPKKKKSKITLIKTPLVTRPPTLKVKPVGRPPPRPLGEGYDSEAEDREVDPVIEEQFLFRMMPGEHCEYLHKAIRERKIGIPVKQGGADLAMKFLDEDGRRVMFSVQGQSYAAILLDLPTITEGMKTWDKKAMVKSADICQMMLVFARVKNEEEAKTAPLPRAVEHGLRWPHGITPPMHDARNRRFRKRLSKLEIKNKEAEVERLLAADKDAKSTRYEFVDERQTLTAAPESGDEYDEEEDGEADAEGEVDDYFGDADGNQQDDDGNLMWDEAQFEAEFMEAGETPAAPADVATPAPGLDAATPITTNTGTPAGQTEESGAEADGGEEESDEDDEDGDDGDLDEDDDGDDNRHDEVAGVRNEIANLRKQLVSYEEQLLKMTQPIMKKRIEASIKNIKSEIRLKQSSIGEADED
ncbi:TAFII55 protein conserved region-domain-containing protein [Cercophora scortea]|uniref:TAFII55 protein conserved region-domain-containing protein n=1 Tax=Cercophora scortea TaxID=314031 RepID=A0AAE0J451_9PEZI|nr:TAFII55 protein conserved region-domain-containing protein [Cercophora scortea]